MTRPTVGITRCSAPADYVDAVRAAGGEPRIIEPGSDPAQVLQEVQAVILSGGGDIDPSRYGAGGHACVSGIDAERDELELALARLALAADRPLLGICRGLQVMNVAFGGSLVQDIPSSVHSAVNHRQAATGTTLAHTVRVAPGSRLSGVLAADLSAEGCCLVNSRHHQAADRPGGRLVVVGTAPDGVVEAVEVAEARFYLGVQWHPENFWRTGTFGALFHRLIEAAR